jgi:hypothetical protein
MNIFWQRVEDALEFYAAPVLIVLLIALMVTALATLR